MDTDSFIFHTKTEDFYEDIANDVEKRYYTSNYKVNRPLPKEKHEKEIGLMKDELGGKIMIQFYIIKLVLLRSKAYSYLIFDGNSNKKVKGTKKCVIKENSSLKIIKL